MNIKDSAFSNILLAHIDCFRIGRSYAIRAAYGYPNGFEDLTLGQARFLSIKSNVEEVLNKLNEVSTKPYQQRPTKCSYHI